MEKKVALVTGASSGIGRAVAVRFARAGYRLAINGRKEAALNETAVLCKEAGAEALCIVGDLCVEDDIARIIEETITTYSQLNVLVNNAGIEGVGSIEDTTLELFDRCIRTHARAPLHLTKLAVPYLEVTKGAVVNVSSTLGIRPVQGAIAYGMSKAALDQLTKCAALDLASKHIRVNCVNPAVVETNILKDKLTPVELDAFHEKQKYLQPLGRNGTVEEIAEAIYFLASDVSGFTTGVSLPVDGGRSCVAPF